MEPYKVLEGEIVWIVTEAELPTTRRGLNSNHVKGLLSNSTVDYGFVHAFALGSLDNHVVIYEKAKEDGEVQVYSSGCAIYLDKEGTTIGLGVHMPTMIRNRTEMAERLAAKYGKQITEASEG